MPDNPSSERARKIWDQAVAQRSRSSEARSDRKSTEHTKLEMFVAMLDALAKEEIETEDDCICLQERPDIAWSIRRSSLSQRRQCVSIRLGIFQETRLVAHIERFKNEFSILEEGVHEIGNAVDLEVTVSGTNKAAVYTLWKTADQEALRRSYLTSVRWSLELECEEPSTSDFKTEWDVDRCDSVMAGIISQEATTRIYNNLLKPYEDSMLRLDFERISSKLRPVLERSFEEENSTASSSDRIRQYKPREFKTQDAVFRAVSLELLGYLGTPLAKSFCESESTVDESHWRVECRFQTVNAKIASEHQRLKQQALTVSIEDRPIWWQDQMLARMDESVQKYL